MYSIINYWIIFIFLLFSVSILVGKIYLNHNVELLNIYLEIKELRLEIKKLRINMNK